eukprot:1099360-Prymnesium_polylepis.1
MAMSVAAVRAWAHGKGRKPNQPSQAPEYLFEHNPEHGIPEFSPEADGDDTEWARFKEEKLVPVALAKRDEADAKR